MSKKVKIKNLEALNAVRDIMLAGGNDAYVQRIPAATQSNIAEVAKALTKYTPHMNEFLDTFINQMAFAVINDNFYSNPLAQFKTTMSFGDYIESIRVNPPDGRDITEIGDMDLLTDTIPDVRVDYHRHNRNQQYKATVDRPMLQRAFSDPVQGFENVANQIINSIVTSSNIDDYLIMANQFKQFLDKYSGKYWNVQIPNIASAADADVAPMSRAIARKIRKVVYDMAFPKTIYNVAGIIGGVSPDRLVLFVTPDIRAALEVETLAYAFTMDKADPQAVVDRIITIDDFGVSGVQAMLVDRDFVICADSVIENTSFFNPSKLTNNYFHHVRGVYSYNPKVNVAVFSTSANSTINLPTVTITGVTLTPAETTISKGGYLDLVPAVAGTVLPATSGWTVPQGVTYTITATESGNPISPLTNVDASGILHVDVSETAASISIVATSTYDTTKSSTAKVITVTA